LEIISISQQYIGDYILRDNDIDI